MSKGTEISWAHHTFNPWWGCRKVSEACKHCYADVINNRHMVDWARTASWGVDGGRPVAPAHIWAEPVKWNASAGAKATRETVFCASMADVFEDRVDLDASRARLFRLIEQTPNLDWLLLTKRIEHVARLVPWGRHWPSNVWLGTSTENQKRVDERIEHLLASHAKLKFISAEPMLSAIDLGSSLTRGLDWVICGGESGNGSRPMLIEWARSLRDQTKRAGKAFHLKQWGWHDDDAQLVRSKRANGRSLDGRIWEEWPASPAAVSYPGTITVIQERPKPLAPAPSSEFFAYVPWYVQMAVAS